MLARERSFTVDDDVEVPSPGAGEVWTVGAVILNTDGHAFAQKRSCDRRLFPGAWDIVGGHVEEGETLLEALAREVEQETGWRLTRVLRFLGTTTWTGDDGGGLRHEADYLVDWTATWTTRSWNGPSTPPATGSAPVISPASRRTADQGST
ncbi:NUDIX hydrolase [Streptomyces sp. NPDC127039]|uniref:NUDIX hydrolase n=1 Tax=Streptomyces sp. NPDC127039 TaxID=3347115 RepID=UPI0036532F0F